MKRILLVIVFGLRAIAGYSEEQLFFLSSEKIVQETQVSLKELRSFAFFPLLKIENKEAKKISDLIDKELEKIGVVIKKPVFTPKGADLDSFSYPTLEFTIEQLVDQKNRLLPILQATLSINRVTELGKDSEFSTLNTNRWSMYLKKSKNVQAVIKKTLPYLLNQFIEDFKSDSGPNQKPIFYICYDASWWETPVNK